MPLVSLFGIPWDIFADPYLMASKILIVHAFDSQQIQQLEIKFKISIGISL